MTLWNPLKPCLATSLAAALCAAGLLAANAHAQGTPATPASAPSGFADAAASAALAKAASQAAAQPASAGVALTPDGTPPVVQWTLQVMRDGQQIDSFDGATTVGQARTDTHHKVVTHNVGCKDQPAGSIDLQRTITVSPLQANASAALLQIDAQETLENPAAPKTTDGCKLPPQPRQIGASHPGLNVPAGQWVNWTIVDKDPTIVYRVRASLAPPSAQP
ncbi:hypothetical protein B0G62_101796 [Paraburkholderia eburnea]|uniref:Uncharacterized protein n=1 Tax=Paraburkholderia eburnea TaxID=1189126 RepID=A0A2S4MPU8_9BURK|nr:hypothetical protein [Paraburkholderia eburnea]POR56397.1 hypothetical protein B0G62_101796 [Paraburkholderia eburnea]PRZ27524.1 hypothetical protein BX588_101795 [Paraburkholderia eburnea]